MQEKLSNMIMFRSEYLQVLLCALLHSLQNLKKTPAKISWSYLSTPEKDIFPQHFLTNTNIILKDLAGFFAPVKTHKAGGLTLGNEKDEVRGKKGRKAFKISAGY